ALPISLALDHEQRQLAEEYARCGQRLSVARLELERLSREDQRSRQQREQSQAAVAQREQERFDQEKALELARGEYERLQARAHAAGEEHAHVRAELAGLDERLRAEKTAAGRIESQIAQMAARQQELERELERMGVERARLLADNIELDQRAAKLSEETASAAAWVENLAAAETAGRASLAGLEEALKALRMDSQSAQERRGAIELELVRKQGDLRYLDETSRRDLNIPAAEVAALEETALDEAGLAEVEQRAQEIRAKIEALGPVNPQALEEFQEAQQRYDFLNTQRQDLLDSIRDTEKAIQELD